MGKLIKLSILNIFLFSFLFILVGTVNGLIYESVGNIYEPTNSNITYIAGIDWTAKEWVLSGNCLNISNASFADYQDINLCYSNSENTNVTLSNAKLKVYLKDRIFSNYIVNATCINLQTNEIQTTNNNGFLWFNYTVDNNTIIKCYGEHYAQKNYSITINSYTEIKETELYLNPEFSVNIIDEKTLKQFNMSSYDEMKLLIYCPEKTTEINIPINHSNTVNFSEDCLYDKIKFQLTYGTEIYYRTILFRENLYSFNVYLINLLTTQSIFNTFQAFDLLGQYDNAKLLFKKRINDSIELITGDYLDVQNSVSTYLLFTNEYIIELESDNNPTRNLGIYTADSVGTIIIRLFDINNAANIDTFYSGVSYSTELVNISGDLFIKSYYKDVLNATNYVKFIVMNESNNILYETISNSNDVTFLFNVTPYMNQTLISYLNISHEYGSTHIYKRIFSIFIKGWNEGISEYVSNTFISWFVIILLTMIALAGDIVSGKYIGVAVVGFAGLFYWFGWFPISLATFGLGLLVAIIEIFSNND